MYCIVFYSINYTSQYNKQFKITMAKIPVDTFKNYVIYLFLMCEIIGTAWICGSNDHKLLRNWYMFTMLTLFGTRLYSFYRKNYILYLLEMCYMINLASMFSIFFNVGVEYLYPFLHGPLIAYSLFYGDALIVHDLDKTTSLAIHSFGAIITRRLYWQGDQNVLLTLNDLTIESFYKKMVISMAIYFLWAIPYCAFYLFPFDGEGYSMVRYVARLKKDEPVSFTAKCKYIFWHMIYVSAALVVGNLSMFCWQLDYLLVITQVMSGIIHGGWHYYKDHKFKFDEAKQDIVKVIENNIKITDSKTIVLRLKDEDDKTKHLELKFGNIPKVITKEKDE